MAKKQKGEKKAKKGGRFKIVLVLLIVLVIVPLLVGFAIYKASDDARTIINNVMSNAPGAVGDFFDSFPTEKETNEQMKQIATYILDIDIDRAVDKLTLLDSEDPKAYDDIVKIMFRINPNATKNILEKIRANNVKKDIVLSTLDTINEEKGQEVVDKAKYLSNLSLPSAIEEMEYILSRSVNGYRELAAILDVMDIKQAATLVNALDRDSYDKVVSLMTINKGSSIREEIANSKLRSNELENVSDIYKTEDISKLVEYIGNDKMYSMEELAQIYINLGVTKSGEVLSKLEDDQFVYKLIGMIKERAIISTGEDKITKDILKSLKIYKDFDDNVTELASVYSKMGSDKVAEIIKKMFRNSSLPKEYELDGGQKIVITDEQLALSILERFNEKQVAEILFYLDNTLSSEISRKMTMPEL